MKTAFRVAAVLATLAFTARAAQGMEPGLDYFHDAGGAIDSLVRWDLTGFFASQPLMGSFSLLVRAPFVALVFHGSASTVYFAGAIPCLLATLILGAALARLVADHGQPRAVQGVVAGLAIINPITFKALHWGHPEELLTAALCVGAVLAAMRQRTILAGVLLGLALATKQWALIAVLPVLLAAPACQLRLGAVAAMTACLLTLPMLLGDPGQFGSVTEAATGAVSAGSRTTPWNVWWPIAQATELSDGRLLYVGPAWVARVSHPAIIAVGLPLALLLWRRQGRRADDALLLMALLFLLRCLLDNWNGDYYHAPFLLSLLAWEATRRPGLPYLSMAVVGALSLSFWPYSTRVFTDSAPYAATLNAVYLAWTLPLAAYLAIRLYWPDRASDVADRLDGYQRFAIVRRSQRPAH